MTAWGLPMTCLSCDGDLRLLAPSTSYGSESRSVVKCNRNGCGWEWLVTTHMRQVRNDRG